MAENEVPIPVVRDQEPKGGVERLPRRGPPSNRLRERLRKRAEEEWLDRLDAIALGRDERLALKAIEVGLKFGIGAAKDIDLEKVREKLVATLEVLRSTLEPDVADEVIRRLAPIWR